jgi:hypothetical protein
MFANRYQINLSTLATGTTATTINIPINMDFQIVDNSELIQRVFVDVEVEKSINPILDYEKVRFLPTDLSLNHIDKIIYNLNLSGLTNYAQIGFTDDDIKYEKSNFKESFLNLAFYDTDNPMTQKLVSNITIFSMLTPTDLQGPSDPFPGQPKPANQLSLDFMVSNPILNPLGFSEGYHLYDYKDELSIGEYKYLYMRGSFKNAKTGRSVNLMVEPTPSYIDALVHKLYTRFKLIRTTTGFYYEIDNTYHGDGTVGPNNVTFASNNATINLYQILAL